MQQVARELAAEAYTGSFSWQFLETLIDIGDRMPGYDGEREAAELVETTLTELGAKNTEISEFDIHGWWRGSAGIQIREPKEESISKDHEVIALPWSSSGDLEADIVDVGYGLPEEFEATDVEGKIAMVSSSTPDYYEHWLHRNNKYRTAVENGAIGFVFRNHVDGQLPPTGGIRHIGKPYDPDDFIPAVGVSKEIGYRLSRYCREGPVLAELDIDCRNDDGISRNVEGVIGPRSDEEILVTSHIDAHDIGDGAADNGAGTALVMELCRLLSPHEEDLETRIRFIGFGSEEIGHDGAVHWTELNDVRSVKCVINLDGIGGSRTLKLVSNTADELGRTFLEPIKNLDIPVEYTPTIHIGGDGWEFLRLGVPGLWPKSKKSEAGRGWGHTHADTLDKLDIRDFRELAFILSLGILRVAANDFEIPELTEERLYNAMNEDQLRRFELGGLSRPIEIN